MQSFSLLAFSTLSLTQDPSILSHLHTHEKTGKKTLTNLLENTQLLSGLSMHSMQLEPKFKSSAQLLAISSLCYEHFYNRVKRLS